MRNQPRKVCPVFKNGHQYEATGKQTTNNGITYAEEQCGCGATRTIPIDATSVQKPLPVPGNPETPEGNR